MKEEIKKTFNDLLGQVKQDRFRQYAEDWKREAVATYNDFVIEIKNCYDDYIYDLDSDEWTDVIKKNLDSRGWLGVKIMLGEIDGSSDYAYLDAYGNGYGCDYDLVDLIEDALKEIDDYE